jgi:hypothetical protein
MRMIPRQHYVENALFRSLGQAKGASSTRQILMYGVVRVPTTPFPSTHHSPTFPPIDALYYVSLGHHSMSFLACTHLLWVIDFNDLLWVADFIDLL